jgi:transcription elongation factor GreA-like protein
LNISNETILLYKTDEILKELNLTFPLFKQVAILSGTDYNIYDNNTSFFETMNWLKEYIKIDDKDHDNDIDFYNWLRDNTKYIQNYESLISIHKMFSFDNYAIEELDTLKPLLNNNYNNEKMKSLMERYGFIFV